MPYYNEHNDDKGLIAGIARVKSGIDKFVNLITIVLMICLIVVIVMQVFWRYVLNNPLAWSEELARYTFVWIVFLSTSIALKQSKHMGIDIIVSLLPANFRKAADILVKLIITAFLVMIIFASREIVMIAMGQSSASLSIPMGLVYLAFPTSAFLMILEFIFQTIIGLKKESKREMKIQ